MKLKYCKILVLLCICLMILCGCNHITNTTISDSISTGEYSPHTISEGPNFVLVRTALNEYFYELYNEAGQVIKKEDGSGALPNIEQTGNLVVISKSYGTGTIEHHFFDSKQGTLSQAYQFVIAYTDTTVATLSTSADADLRTRNVVIQDIFNVSSGTQEFQLQNIAEEPMPIVAARFDSNKLTVQYRSASGSISEKEIMYMIYE